MMIVNRLRILTRHRSPKCRRQWTSPLVVPVLSTVTPGEYVECLGTWSNDRTHGLQFRTTQLQVVPPSSIEGIEKYLGSGMVRFVGSPEPQYLVPPEDAGGVSGRAHPGEVHRGTLVVS